MGAIRVGRIAVMTLSIVATGLISIGTAQAEEPTADLQVEVSAPRHILPTDGWSSVTTTVRNAGTGAASDVRLVIALPSNLHSSGWQTSSEWNCTSPGGWPMVLTCDHVGDLAPGATPYPVTISTYPSEAAVGDTIDVRADVTTSSPESDTGNNSATGTLSIVGKGIIQGRVWNDANANGVQDSGEGLAGGLFGIEVVFRSVDDEDQYGTANANNFPYAYAVPAKKYYAEVTVSRNEWSFTTPDAGDDATDSDVTQVAENSFYRTARSAEFTVSEAGTVTIDVGLVPAA